MGLGDVGYSSFGVEFNPLIICEASVQSFKNEILFIFESFISPGKFSTFITKVNKIAAVNAIPEDSGSSGINEVSSKLFRGSKDLIEVSPDNPGAIGVATKGVGKPMKVVP